ncbi:uncharacterized protein LOC126882756 [Diabrotica virgifera virgifera]|nr:uncharacterized protein LOC126882756 [Diabrotica virgifera virgifera]
MEEVILRIEPFEMFTNLFVKSSAVFLNHNVAKSLILDTKLFWSVEDCPYSTERKTGLLWYKVSKFLALWYPGLGVVSAISNVILTLKDKVLPFSTFVPESPPYWVLHVLQDYSFLTVTVGAQMFDVFFATLMMMVVIQWRMFNRELVKMLETKVDTKEERILFKHQIQKLVDYHNFLRGYVERINKLMAYVNLEMITLVVVTYCVSLFVILICAPDDALTRIALLFLYTNEFLLFYILPAQLLTSEAENTERCAYGSSWYESGMDLKKPILLMISSISKRPVYISAARIFNFTFATGLSTYKLIFSYYTFLSKMDAK